jgi:hypothetical protein
MTEDSFIQTGIGGTSFVGPDAVALFQATVLRSAIEFYLKTKMLTNRAYTPTAMRAAASRITGKPYKRTELAKAAADLVTWCDAMKAALPVIDRDGRPR